MDILTIFMFLGGLGLFLFGMQIMQEGLEKTAGDNLRTLLEKTTTNPLSGICIGTGVTMLIQSSSATTVMVVSFVSAGLMTLPQAMNVIIGANIGTTITAQIIAFKIDSVAPLILFIGMLPVVFGKKKIMKNVGMIILGFGIIFLGMRLMSESVEPLRTNEVLTDFLVSFDNPVLAILAGTIFTAVVQSSSASIAIMQAFASEGLIGFHAAAFIVIGMNLGTCITGILASLSSGRNGKCAAFLNLFYNIIKITLATLVIVLLPVTLTWIENLSPGNVARQIANLHMIMNIVAALLLTPGSKLIVRITERLIGGKDENAALNQLMYLDRNVLQTPALAAPLARREICRMGDLVRSNLRLSMEAFFELDADKAKRVLEVEQTINYLNHAITGWLVELRALDVSQPDREKLGMMFHVVNDIERIGDHAENISEYASIAIDRNSDISEEGIAELREISAKTLDVVELSLDIYEHESFDRLNIASAEEEEVDELQDTMIENHVKRLMAGKCDPRGGIMFTDMVTDLERCADHAINIAYSIEGEHKSFENALKAKQERQDREHNN
ncbi:MAG: Na/Pi cotransporter family protein [Clostridiaceae bacterium]|nr:Na/Pi cotransporter family protein [Clostridiaceae bacterium]MDD6275019.1 Na/Pi cotransporter family protein [Clostridiaceae bacterium]